MRWCRVLGAPLITIALTACVPIGAGHTVGRAVDEKAPIEIGVTTREEMIARLGEPDAIWESERVFAYGWEHTQNLWLGIFIHTSIKKQFFFVQFDGADHVARAELVERPWGKSYGEFLAGWAKGGAEKALTVDESSTNTGSSAVLMLRFVVQDKDGNRLEPFREIPGISAGPYLRIGLGNSDSGGKPESHDDRTLSAIARNEGWIAFVLPYGYYYLVVTEPNCLPSYASEGAIDVSDDGPRDCHPLARWRIEVPPGPKVIYAGTFHIYGTTAHSLFVGRYLSAVEQAATKIEDETKLARSAALRDLTSLPPPVTRLAVLNTGPILLGVPAPMPPSK